MRTTGAGPPEVAPPAKSGPPDHMSGGGGGRYTGEGEGRARWEGRILGIIRRRTERRRRRLAAAATTTTTRVVREKLSTGAQGNARAGPAI